jgi:hypothetical protein
LGGGGITKLVFSLYYLYELKENKLMWVSVHSMALNEMKHNEMFYLSRHKANKKIDVYELHTFIDVSNDPDASKSPYGWKSKHRIAALCPVNVRTIFAASKSQILSAPVFDPAHTSSSVCPNCTHSTGVEWPLRLCTIK